MQKTQKRSWPSPGSDRPPLNRGVVPFWGVLLCLFWADPATSIVIRHDREEAEYLELAETVPPIVVQVGGGVGTLLSADWILTAGHVAEGFHMRGHKTLTTDGVERKVAAVHVHPQFGVPDDHRDIGLIQLEPSTEFHADNFAELYIGSDEVGRQVLLVGDGYTGNGKTGPVKGERILRAAHNTVEEAADGWIRFHFDAPPAGDELEGISGPGDSGGPALLLTDGRYHVIGVSAYNAGEPTCTYGTDEFYCRVSDELPWIRMVMKGEMTAEASADEPRLMRYGTDPSGQQTVARERIRKVPVSKSNQADLWQVIVKLTDAIHKGDSSAYLALFDPSYRENRKGAGDPLENMFDFMQGVVDLKGRVDAYHSIPAEGIEIPDSAFPMRPVVFHLEDGTAGYYGLAVNTEGKIDHFSLFVQDGICREERPCQISKRVSFKAE